MGLGKKSLTTLLIASSSVGELVLIVQAERQKPLAVSLGCFGVLKTS
jgi:hypothetical protein